MLERMERARFLQEAEGQQCVTGKQRDMECLYRCLRGEFLSADLRELLRRMVMCQCMAFRVDLHFESRMRLRVDFLLFRSAPSSSVVPIRGGVVVATSATSSDYFAGGCDEPCKICGDVVITDIKNQDMRIYFCLDREAVQIQGPGLFVFDVLG